MIGWGDIILVIFAVCGAIALLIAFGGVVAWYKSKMRRLF